MGGVQKERDKYRDFLVIDVNEEYEKSGHLIGSEYFRHAYGPIYVLFAEVVASLAIARNNRTCGETLSSDLDLGKGKVIQEIARTQLCSP
ncbi:hypothetical protein ACE6H2_002095 [Prunus campanulata]